MINNAVDLKWLDSAKKESSTFVKEMVQKGVWYLERAKDDVESVLEASNVKELLKEDHRVILSLFGIEN